MTPEQQSELHRLLNRLPQPGDYEALLLPVTLKELVEHADGGQQHVRFAELCRLAAAAFPAKPTNQDILSNPATPDLVRYLLAALRNYRSRLGSRRTAVDRQRVLADAFALVGSNDRRPGKWTLESKISYLSAFSAAARGALLTGHPWPKAYQVGVEAAYQAYRGESEGVQKGSERTAVIRQIKRFLAEHNYLRKYSES